MGWEYLKCFWFIIKISEFQWDFRHEVFHIKDYIYSHLLPRDCVIFNLKGINYCTFILVQCISL